MSVAEPVPFVRVTDDTTLEELRETLRLLCDGAKRISRQGAGAMTGEMYVRQHARMNAILGEILARS